MTGRPNSIKNCLRRFKRFALSIHPYCQWCNLPLTFEIATADHIVPESKGGSHSWSNLLLACWECNQRRANDYDADEIFEGPRWSDDHDSILLLRGASTGRRPPPASSGWSLD